MESKLFNHLIEDSAEIKSTSNDNNSKPNNYGEYLDTQIKNAQKQKIDFSKADDNKIKTIAKNYATIAKSKYGNIQGLPKNDNDANEMLKASINKNAMDNASSNTNDSINKEISKAQDEINNITKDLIESTQNSLSKKSKKILNEYKLYKEETNNNIKEYFSKNIKKENKLNFNEIDNLFCDGIK